jgi:sugar phosphate isomerase/epimerase
MMFKTGLVSISFRNLSPEILIDMTVQAELDGIEWGGDVHVPHGNTKEAERVRKLCEKNGIDCPSYGSYYRVGEYPYYMEEFQKSIDCASVLGCRDIRVWAGTLPTAESNNDHFNRISDELSRICDMASEYEMGIALEYHANTLTDNADDTLKLIETVNRDNLTTYWQPPVDRSIEENLRDIELLSGHISNIHTYTWYGRERRELKKGYGNWVNYLKQIEDGNDRYCLLEFIKDDSIEIFYRDALTLRTLTELF